MSIVYLNGQYLPIEEAKISVLDRGFTFADAIYEVIPVYGGDIFRLREHLDRLDNCLTEIEIDNPFPQQTWKEIFSEVLQQNPASTDRSLYVQVSRGVGEREHLHEEDLNPTVFVMCRVVKEKDYSKGVSAITHEDIRWKYCHIKTTALLPSVLLKQRARRAEGAIETILIRDGFVTEAATSNVFVVNNGTVITPEKDGNVLPGITRDLLVELLNSQKIPCEEKPISESELKKADEVWLTSSTMGVVAVVQLDSTAVGEGKPGKLWFKADELYQKFKHDPSILT
jgi:D-alanine transaminase